MINIKKRNIYLAIFIGLFFNSCSSNRDLMFGASIAEYAIPISFKSHEKKIKNDAFNSEVYLNASKSLTQYSYGILMEKADRLMYADYYTAREYYSESLDLFLTSKNYMIQALSLRHVDFESKMKTKAEVDFHVDDVPYLYWLSGSMAGSIQASQGDPEYLIDLNNIRWLLENAIAIDPDWEKGSLYAAMMSVYLNDLSGDKDSERKALEYFELADRAAKGYNIGIYVTLAESFAVSKQDKAYFLELIDKALTIDISKDKDMKQANTLSKLRASWLLTRVDDLFYM
ncbi:MAG: hypothetical protein CMG20_00970 [Candidatus Marinimicrobia bacterium]|nr:hypothetical protein [Candidatus Neomarinimicrobiota bacterium]